MKTKNLWESFHHAFDGLMHCIRHERNIRIHLTMGCLALILAVALSVKPIELVVLVLIIAAVIVSEMINTAIENVIDLVSRILLPARYSFPVLQQSSLAA